METLDQFLPLLVDAVDEATFRSEVHQSDFEAAQKAAAGDREAFEEIYWKYHQRVFGICYRMTKDASEAEDLTQQVFIHLFKKIGSFKGNSALATWLHRMTVNLVLMQFRKNRAVKEQVTDDGEMPEIVNLSGKTIHGNQVVSTLLINEAIANLPDGYRKILILHDVQGFEHEEIAKMLNCSAGTSKSQLFKARRKLRKQLENLRSR